MKTNITKRYKWCIVAILLLLALAAVSISFSAWDTLSVKAMLNSSGSGNYYKMYKVATDNNGNKIADVGDVVTFGQYYQQANQTTKTPIRWIVVEKENDELTLLAEQILAGGSFWGTYYHDENGGGIRGGTPSANYYQSYSESTVRVWLNYSSNNKILGNRTDGGSLFDVNSNRAVFRGFANEAFTSDEYNQIIAKEISGIQGYGKLVSSDSISTELLNFSTVKDKVWLPSYGEIFGTDQSEDGKLSLGSPNKKFAYFDDVQQNGNIFSSKKAIGKMTGFATSQYGNYTDINATAPSNYNNLKANDVFHWLTRTPATSLRQCHVVALSQTGTRHNIWTDNSRMAVRPAIIIPA